MTCPECKELMRTPTVDEPVWFCGRCGLTTPDIDNKIEREL